MHCGGGTFYHIHFLEAECSNDDEHRRVKSYQLLSFYPLSLLMGCPYKQPYKHVMRQAIHRNDDEDAALKCLYAVALARANIRESRMRVCIPLLFHI